MALNKSPLECIVPVHQGMPDWLERIDRLTQTANERYAQWMKESEQIGEPTLKKGKTGSMESLRPQDDTKKALSPKATPSPDLASTLAVDTDDAVNTSLKPLLNTKPGTPPVTKIDIDPNNKHLFKDIREQRRKRKDPSLKEGASGPARFKQRGILTVWYDSSVQSEFATLVRDISAARNALRKGKTATSLRMKFGSHIDEEDWYGQHVLESRYQTRSVPRLSQPGSSYLSGLNTGLERYDHADRELESAQTLCEVGAHQFLRDADCFDELEGTKSRVEKCIELLAEEIGFLKKQEVVRKSPDGASDETVHEPVIQSFKQSISSVEPDAIRIDGPLEVDDSADQESIEIDLMQLPGRRHYSSKHMMMDKIGVRNSDAGRLWRRPSDLPSEEQPEPEATTVDSKLYERKNRNRDSTDAETSLVDNILIDGGINVVTSESEDDDEGLDPKIKQRSMINRFSVASNDKSEANKGIEPSVDVGSDAMAIAVAPDADEAELNLSAMRHSVGFRTSPAIPTGQVPAENVEHLVSKIHDANKVLNSNMDVPIPVDIAVEASAEDTAEPTLNAEPDLDLAAMRSSVGRRKADAGQDSTQTCDQKVPENSHLGNSEHQLSPHHPLAPESATKSDLSTSPHTETTPSISSNITSILESIKKTKPV